VPQVVCSVCQRKARWKLATVYWATTDQGVRSAWKQRFCAACFPSLYEALRTMRDHSEQCPECNMPLLPDQIVTYWATVYVPGSERLDTSLDVCFECRSTVLSQLRRGATDLENRRAGEGGPLPQPQAASPWDALGDLSLDPTQS